MAKIAVVGAGVSGLSSALRLLQAGHHVTVYAREHGKETTSAAAGAVWWGHVSGKARDWALVSLKHFQAVSAVKNSGVRIIRLRDVYPYRVEAAWFANELSLYQRIPRNELMEAYTDGFLMEVPLIEPPLYLSYLRQEIERLGGKIEKAEIRQLADLGDSASIIVNCSGLGARELVQDKTMFPVRGQVLRVDAPNIKEGFMDDESFTYIFPRGDGVLLGGIAQFDNESLGLDPQIRDDILRRCAAIEPSIEDSKILGEAVGLRPGRETVRLEVEELSENCRVIHNYGHGGVGFTLSWGCAEDVAKLVGGAL